MRLCSLAVSAIVDRSAAPRIVTICSSVNRRFFTDNSSNGEGRYALVNMCIGGGQGIAVIFERL